uniref:RNA-directed RNA polymerase n=1 Tax=Sclerotinia sclerotiorum double-stranded RNA virus 3 TaxID=1848505 RepID=A0A172QER3_9VIRU|nr:RNA-dependent RNA polymerase [Sclerotinia sclerotiorum double-stranded RNA virus 3]
MISLFQNNFENWVSSELNAIWDRVDGFLGSNLPWAVGIRQPQQGDWSVRKPAIHNGIETPFSRQVPTWVIGPYKTYNRVASFNKVKRLYDDGVVPKAIVTWWFLLLYPGIFPPVDLVPDSGEPLLQENLWHCQRCTAKTGNGKIELGFEYDNIKSVLELPDSNLVAKAINSCFPYITDVSSRKANVDVGHTYIWIRDHLKTDEEKEIIKSFLKYYWGCSNSFVSALLLYWVGVIRKDVNIREVLEDAGFFGTCELCWIDHFKGMHDMIRRTRTYKGFHLSPERHSKLLYIHQLIGRTGADADWETEIKDRTTRPTVKYVFDRFSQKWCDKYADKVYYSSITDVLKTVRKNNRPLESLEDYFKRAYEWIASGSASGMGSTLSREDARLLVQERLRGNEIRGNKRSVAERINYDELLAVLKSTPIQDSKAQVKLNELGKTPGRAIYSVSFYHYLLNSYCTSMIEEGLNHPSIDLQEAGLDELDTIIRRQALSKLGLVINSYDYKNFNAQHQTKHMRLVFRCVGEFYKRNYVNDPNLPIMLEVTDWVDRSFSNQWFKVPAYDEWFNCVGTLFSGVRSTTLINTLLNVAYMEGVWHSYRAIYNKTPQIASLHHGDDVLAYMKGIGESALCNEIAMKTGLVASEGKLLNDYGYGEYLRMMYYEDGQVWGSVCRSISTLVNGNWESDIHFNPEEDAKALFEQISVCIRRGFDPEVAELLKKDVFNKFVMLPKNGPKGVMRDFYLRKSALTVNKGGLGLGDLVTGEVFDGVLTQKEKTDKKKDLPDMFKLQEKLKMTNNYLHHIEEKLPYWATFRKEDKRRLINKLAWDTLGLELPNRVREKYALNEILDAKIVLKQPVPPVIPSISERNPLFNFARGVESMISDMLSFARIAKKIKVKERKVDKLKLLIPYLTFSNGYSRQDFWMYMIGYIPDDEVLDSIDSSWKGMVPNVVKAALAEYYNIIKCDINYLQSTLNYISDNISSLHLHF